MSFLTPFVVNLLSGALPLFGGGLSNQQTNGNVDFRSWQNLPKFLPSSPRKYGTPWGSLKYEPGSVNEQMPDTGVTRHYDFDIAPGKLSPDGYQKDMLLFNGQYPGPLIEANWGDWVEIKVTNSLQSLNEGTAVHWHGLRQYQTQFADGVPGLVQCPIAPGSSFTYRFRADHVGSSWYHSHYSAQISSGLIGPMVFYGPRSQPYDIDMGPIMVNDLFHPYYEQLVEHVLSNSSGSHFVFSDNNLINGKMDFDCALVTDGTPCVSNAGVSKFQFRPGKDHLLRVVNTGSAGLQFFTIDEHEMTVISNDFIPITPYKTNSLTLGVGQRNDVIVRGKTGAATQQPYWMRTNLSVNCALPHQPYGLAAIYYDRADFAANKKPTSQPQPLIDAEMPCQNAPLDASSPIARIPAPPADKVVVIQVLDVVNSTGHTIYHLNNQTGRVNYNEPVLRLANEGNFSYPMDPDWNILDTSNSSVVRLVWENRKVDSSDPNFFNRTFAHPMHLHGHDYQVLSYGPGEWDGTIINGDNPIRRDTTILPPSGHLVMQFTTDNPGIWPVHCHVAWHVSAGFLMNIMERPQDIDAQQNIEQIMAQTCDAWDAWSRENVVNQVDSGLRRMAMERER
ncbi:multicopper oxidase-3 [Coleophoma cylindrospora]|uniref:Multicopper oxidase-3 n=1 Tax=Coleophoma cylindrospora TaxID=1849047 RepID=A0A3D8QGR1_9HELO|nr:multicopper oxidase-3 [Coleophoma cylindrospora]